MFQQPIIYTQVEEKWCYYINETDQKTIATLVWLEAGSQGQEAMQRIAEVILNRLNSETYTGTINHVVYDPEQFTPADKISSTTAPELAYEAMRNVFKNGVILMSKKPLYFCSKRIKRRFERQNQGIIKHMVGIYFTIVFYN